MKDFLGNELQVGDYVATMIDGYSSLQRFEIVKFTPKSLAIKLPPTFYDSYKGRDGHFVYKSSCQVVKVA